MDELKITCTICHYITDCNYAYVIGNGYGCRCKTHQCTGQRPQFIITHQLPDPCTIEQYEQITGEEFPDDGLVWERNPYGYQYTQSYRNARFGSRKDNETAIVQTGKPCPDINWKPEVKS